MDPPLREKSLLCKVNEWDTPVKRSPLALLQWKTISQNTFLLNNKHRNAFYLSPLETQAIRKKRAQQFGLTPPTDPYLLNQSYPCIHKRPENGNSYAEMGGVRNCTIDKLKGDALNSVRYPQLLKSSFIQKAETHQNRHLNESWLFCQYVEGGSGNTSIHACIQNPNKAIVTINARTTEILIANKVASFLLGIEERTGKKVKLCDYILSREDKYSFTDTDLQSSGELILISGKVMDLITPTKEIIPVSVWARKLYTDVDPRCLVVMEPVERVTGEVEFSYTCKIISCDKSFATLFGCLDVEELKGLDIRDLIPSLELDSENNCGELVPKKGMKQCATGRTKDGSHFPLSIKVRCATSKLDKTKDFKQDGKEASGSSYKGTVWVFNNISGLITLQPDGTIHSCNTNFSLMLFGYSQNELVGKNISFLIPTFYDDVEFLDTDSMALPPFDDDEDSNARCCCASDGRTTADSIGTDPPRPANPMGRHTELIVDETTEMMQNLGLSPSPSDNQVLQHYNELSPFVKDKYVFDNSKQEVSDSNEKVSEYELSRNEELSESSQYGNSSRHLSYSESQDTLHSCTNSIAESDLNANVLQPSDSEDLAQSLELLKDKDSFEEEKEYDSPSYFSDSSDNEESYSSLAEDLVPNKLNFLTCDNKKVSSVNIVDLPDHKMHSDFEKPISPPCSNLSDYSSNSLAFQVKSSTPRDQQNLAILQTNDDSYHSIPEGVFFGVGRHKDDTDLAIEYYIKKISLEDGKHVYCLWISRDTEEAKECSPHIAATSYSTSHSGTHKTDQSKTEESDASSASDNSLKSDSFYITGTFSDHYTILQHIGKGAFGCVKKAYRNSDGLLVIAKFIRQSEVYKDLWVYDNQQEKKVPLEISLLTTIKHPNVVTVLDVFENENCFQMVMEKHGSGMDLFEFIERDPDMDEPLASYIFRQVASALSYLHSLFILHRDIKDENIILDEKFHVKLIDFGSATFMGKELFSTFCGTMEYCSPEVIQGNKYRGPELEMWALGVTLYTLIFGENPFVDVDETLKGEIRISHTISEDLSKLIFHLLEPDPVKRCTLSEVEQHPWTTQPICIENYKFSRVVNAREDEVSPLKYINNFEDENILLDNSNCTDSGVSYETKDSIGILPLSSTESEADSLS